MQIKYGLISETDAKCLEKTIDLICEEETKSAINILEVGIYAGETGNGIRKYAKTKYKHVWLRGIDNNKDNETIRFKYDKLIIGDADEVAFKIADNSQHLVFIDSCHCFAHVVSNFFSYAPKVKVGGYMAFHDTGKHIKPFKDFQHGDMENPDAYISVRKALETIGILWPLNSDEWIDRYAEEWELIFDEADVTNLLS